MCARRIRVESSCLGFPRIGPKRELKRVVERFWKGTSTADQVEEVARQVRAEGWKRQIDAGIQSIPCNDFSLFDHVLDTAVLVGAIPSRYEPLTGTTGNITLQSYYAMTRGFQDNVDGANVDVPALEMQKWFDTNYHFLKPELWADTKFSLRSTKPFDEFAEARTAGVEQPRPLLLGPVSFLLLARAGNGSDATFEPISLLERLLPVYEEVTRRLIDQGARTIQFDEPCVVLDHDNPTQVADALRQTYSRLHSITADNSCELMFCTYFETPSNDLVADVVALPIDILHVDVTRSHPDAVQALFTERIAGSSLKALSVGVVNGRNIWKVDASKALTTLQTAAQSLPSGGGGGDAFRLIVGTSCSLLHVPYSLELEEKLSSELKDWLAFATEKLGEVSALTSLLSARLSQQQPSNSDQNWLDANIESHKRRGLSPLIHNATVAERLSKISPAMLRRPYDIAARRKFQDDIALPLFPVTTIGSFPQTTDVRKARAAFKKGTMSGADYEKFLDNKMAETIKIQEDIGIDVLVHGEYERNDMVEFFAEHLSGFAFTSFGWVQSCGTLCVKPPIIFGDVQRLRPMTVAVSKRAQSLTSKPMKGMLTGPITILQWSFVRDDQSRKETCQQLALAVRDEVTDLEKVAGLRCIQIDEPAIREGLPLRTSRSAEYLQWAVDSFLLATTVASERVQVHTHLCYSDFNLIMKAILRMDADVLSIESARSDLKAISSFRDNKYPAQLGPGLFDVHSSSVPTREQMRSRVQLMLESIRPEQLWFNPDCGLKTRDWKEVKLAMQQVVALAAEMRPLFQEQRSGERA